MLRGWTDGYEVPSFGVLVDAKHRGKGLGRQLMRFAIDEARNLGCHELILSVYGSNEDAIGLYSSFGFEVSKVIRIRIEKR